MLDKFFGGPTAFDYFLRGQEAKQNYDMNQQLMQARSQEMAQAEMMNPLLLQAQRASIAHRSAATQSAIAGEQRAADLHPLSVEAAQAEIDEFNAASQREKSLHPGELDKQAALIEQARAAAASSRASTQKSNFEQSARELDVLGQYAMAADEMTEDEFEGYKTSNSEALASLGVDINNVTLEDAKNISTMAKGARRLQGNAVQQASYIDGLGYVQQLKSGEVRLQELTPDQKEKVKLATQEMADIKAESAAKKAEATASAKSVVKFEEELDENAFQARRYLPQINRLKDALATVGTGVTQKAKATFGQFLPGVDPSDEQALNAALNEQVFTILSQFKGAISDGERLFAKETITNMGNTTEANMMILDRLATKQNDLIEEHKQYKEHKQEGGKKEDFEFSPDDAPQRRVLKLEDYGL